MIAKLRYPALALLLALVSVSILVLALVRFDGINVNWDSVSYLSMADSLLMGDGFRVYNSDSHSHDLPPGYSIAVAGASWLFQTNTYNAAKAVNALLYGIAVFVALLWLRDIAKRRLTLILGVIITVASVPLLSTSLSIMTDPVLATVSMVGVYLMHRMHRDKNVGWIAIITITATAVMVAMSRWMGISVGMAASLVILLLAWEQAKRVTISMCLKVLIPTILPMMLVLIWISTSSSADSAAKPITWLYSITTLPELAGEKFLYHIVFFIINWFAPIAQFIYPWDVSDHINHWWPRALGSILLLLLLALCVWVCARGMLRTRYAAPSIFIVVYVLLLVVVSSTVWAGVAGQLNYSTRRVDPIYLPLILMLLVFFLDDIIPKLQPRRMISNIIKYSAYGAISLLLLMSLWGLHGILVNPAYGTKHMTYGGVLDTKWEAYYDIEFAIKLRETVDAPYLRTNHPPFVYYLGNHPGRIVMGMDQIVTWTHLRYGDWIVWMHAESHYKSIPSDINLVGNLVLGVVYEDEVGTIYRVLGKYDNNDTDSQTN